MHFPIVLAQSKQPVSASDAYVVVLVRVGLDARTPIFEALYPTQIVGDCMDVTLMAAVRVSPPLQEELQRNDGLPGQTLAVSLNRMKVSRTGVWSLYCPRIDPSTFDI